MDIRKICEADLLDLKLLLDELIDKDASIERMKKVLRLIEQDENYLLLGMFDEGILIGTASVVKCYDISGDCTPFLVMENFIIHSKYRNMGYGSDLLKYIEDYGKADACRYIIFVSSKGRPISHAFYKKNGYDLDLVQGFKKYLNK